ncbi:MAG TPA: diacylglycerol kinase family protein [Acidimicrobiales bacterium]|nr:diacylglycerol kinase family protein [Acidimicrobiales bacterium]
MATRSDAPSEASTIALGWTASVLALATGGRFGRRAALRGSAAALATAGVTAAFGAVTGLRRAVPSATAGSLAFAVGATLELPRAGVPLAAAAAAFLGPDLLSGRPRLGSLVAAVGGAGVALGSRQLWPLAPHSPTDRRPAGARHHHQPAPHGAGLTMVVNPGAGSNVGAGPLQRLSEALPEARLVELEEGDDLTEALELAATEGQTLGVVGGDGSINAAASIAHGKGIPLFAVPGGTLNHFTHAVGIESVDDAVTALTAGEVVAVDLAQIDGRPFLNTASFGAYVELVDARERLEHRLGKWPAMIVALVQVLRRSRPMEVEIDGRERKLWMIFVGNCTYRPHGFAPSWRTRLDGGRLDVRLVDASTPRGRVRLIAAVLTGRLGRCRMYEESQVTQVRVRRLDGDRRLARDGETFDGSAEFAITKCTEPLLVYAPH